MHTIGILKENNPNEKRALLVPNDVKKLSKHFNVLVESDLGTGINFSNESYRQAGAKIETRENIWKKANLIFKYKAPEEIDYNFFQKGKTICALMHPEGNPELIEQLNLSKMRSFSFEYFKTKSNIFPLAYTGGEIAGKMAVFYANHFLQTQYGGLGKALFSVYGSDKAHVMVIGYGHVGGSAIKTLLNIGAKVTVVGNDLEKMAKNRVFLDGDVDFVKSTPENIAALLPSVDAVIGAILISTFDTPPVITKEMMTLMKPGSVIIDVTCGYGEGYLPGLREKTSLHNPIKLTDTGQIYCKIDNLPSAYPVTTSQSYSNQIVKVIPRIADYVFNNVEDGFVKSGEITRDGKTVHLGVKNHIEKFYQKGLSLK